MAASNDVEPPPADGLVETPTEKKARIKAFVIGSAKFVGSQIGLVVLIVVYAIIGAVMFEHLEKANEMDTCLQKQALYEPLQNDTVYKFWQIATSFTYSWDQPYAVQHFQDQLSAFRDSILQLGYDGTNCTAKNDNNGAGYAWNFWGSLLFSTTIFTTVGALV